MSLAEIYIGDIPAQPAFLQQRPTLEAVSSPDVRPSRQLFNEYYELRNAAAEEDRPQGEALTAIQEDVKVWIEENQLVESLDYTTYRRETVEAKIGGLVHYLRKKYGSQIPESDLTASTLFVESAFSMWEDTPETGTAEDADGSFAFIVPVRASRERDDYGSEADGICPALRYVPNEYKAAMSVCMPPLVLDMYQKDPDGRRGYLVMAPVYGDMALDMSKTDAARQVPKNVADAVHFAQSRLGVRFMGLGATIPGYTNHGKSIQHAVDTEAGHLTTSGHGGTTYLILETIRAALEQGNARDENGEPLNAENVRNIGMLGLGAIGGAATSIIADAFPNARINAYDPVGLTRKLSKIHQAVDTLRQGKGGVPAAEQIIAAESEGAVIEGSDITVSAVNVQFDLDKMGVGPLEGQVVIDDCQPDSFNAAQLQKRGGVLLGVVGLDAGEQPNGQSTVVRQDYDYGMLENAQRHVFGCEAEVASLYRYWKELQERGMDVDLANRIVDKLALRSEVTVQSARYFGALFKKYGIVAANVVTQKPAA